LTVEAARSLLVHSTTHSVPLVAHPLGAEAHRNSHCVHHT
jgi:hypothetical protein